MALIMRVSRVSRIVTCRSPTTLNRAQTRNFTKEYLTNSVQIYRSTSTDPYINLSVEHYLLQNSHPDSTILFLYVNRPSIVIGRNQNPWLEVDLNQLRKGLPPPPSSSHRKEVKPKQDPQEPHNPTHPNGAPIDLVRRRSGGGTVYHDLGNTNYSVICPPAVFDRDRHAEMVARALTKLRVDGVRVNERHDIVVDRDRSFKISGSAYKLTRTRSLHHGTCLLSTENLWGVSKLFRSPAAGFIKARGVESVKSEIMNVGVEGDAFADAVVAEFGKMYGEREAGAVQVVTEKDALENQEVVKGVKELMDPDWIFGQTPQFTFSTHWYPRKEDPEAQPAVLPGMPSHPASGQTIPENFKASFTARHGVIESATISSPTDEHQLHDEKVKNDAQLSLALTNQRLKIHDIPDWQGTLEAADGASGPFQRSNELGAWLNFMFGIPSPKSLRDTCTPPPKP